MIAKTLDKIENRSEKPNSNDDNTGEFQNKEENL
jgi:hypothetical protein